MATTISRSFKSPRFSRRYLHSLCRWPAAPREPPLRDSSPLLPPVIIHGRGLGGYCCGVYGSGYLFSTAADAVNPGNPDKKITVSTNGAADATTSGGEEKAGGSQQSSEDSGSQQSSEDGGSQQSSEAGKPVRGGPVSWLSFLLLVATGLGIILYYDKEKKRHIEDINSSSRAVKQGPSAGKAAIGGPFNLINDEGKPVTEKDFLGKWTVIYFGFTHCPDICPDELQKLASTVDKIKEKAGIEVVPVFISVDPERDTVQQVHEYVKEFHPKLIGLTGSPEEIKKVARAYRVYYMKTAEEDSDYLVDHSIVMYLMDPDMEFVKFFGKNNDIDALTDGITNEIKQYKKQK